MEIQINEVLQCFSKMRWNFICFTVEDVSSTAKSLWLDSFRIFSGELRKLSRGLFSFFLSFIILSFV